MSEFIKVACQAQRRLRMSIGLYLGIDIAKDTFHVTLLQGGQTTDGNFANDQAGFKKLAAWLKKRNAKTVWACLEATGRYGDELAQALYQAGHSVSVVNPLVIRSFAQSQLTRNKTDGVDAELIARYCQTQQPALWSPPPTEVRELQEIMKQYDALQASLQQVKNRQQSGFKSAVVLEQLQAQRTFLEQQLKELLQRLRDHFDRHPNLRQRQDLLESIPGIGEITAAKIQAENIDRFEDASAFAAYAGVTPMNRTSGSSVRKKAKMSKIGAADLRRGLYLPAVTALRWNPLIRQLYDRLRERGKCKMVALGAAMHKLLRLAYGVLKSNLPFDPSYHLRFQFPP
jgi:transposase